jgi:hypothetical protein
LENAAQDARDVAEAGALAALNALAVPNAVAFPHLNEADKKLRVALRAQARQLGDVIPKGEVAPALTHLVEKVAYDTWHRLLFTRYLAENKLLQHPGGASVSLQDCEELIREDLMQPQREFTAPDGRTLAVEFAARMLPAIFRADDPAGKVGLPPENRNALFKLIDDLPRDVFVASDSLGWCYQFWQARRKEEVNRSGRKIGADELPSVTQLFTEDYMVDFLLDNTLGAWHAGKILAANPKLAESAESEDELRQAVALPGCPWKYLRFIKGENGKWTPAAGTFDGWPKTAKELKCFDPCMGSGHFVVAMFERLVALRMAEERVDEAVAVAAVIRDNLFGLEIDPRCTQIGAFNLAMAAWRRVGHRQLPTMNLACSGLAPNTREADWLAIAGSDGNLQNGMARLYRLFKNAPVLGSLINPRSAQDELLEASFHELQPLLEKALAQESTDDNAHEMAVTARGLAKAAEILASQFTLVATNVPYLGRRKQNEVLMDYCERVYPESKKDLATCFIERCLAFCESGSSISLLVPQNWLFLGTYESLRVKLLQSTRWDFVCRMGAKAFQTPMYDFGVAMHSFTAINPNQTSHLIGFDVGSETSPENKALALPSCSNSFVNQLKQLRNPDSAIIFQEASKLPLLSDYADSHQGAHTFDMSRFRQCFWEMNTCLESWNLHSSSPTGSADYSGYHYVSFKREDHNAFGKIIQEIADDPNEKRSVMWRAGHKAWGKIGIACAWMGTLPVSLYIGQVFDNSVAAIIPKDHAHLLPIYCFCSSPIYLQEIRKINQKTQVADSTLIKVPFDLAHWQNVASEKYPDGLPKPFSSDPTQWLFTGCPAGADQPLQVAMARLLGYQWPRQTGSSFPDCPALGPDGLEKFADDDGIVCIPAAGHEQPAEHRLRALLAAAYGAEWSAAKEGELLAQAEYAGKSMEDWLRNGFAEQHGKFFQQRPFVWHLWDGRKDGFSALVNYHKLDRALLDKLIYTYLGDWITRQESGVQSGEGGSDARLTAARDLQRRLKLIAEGEPPFDIFVRWKPLGQQPIGWEPDLNDGVRLNIRPFVEAGVLRKDPNVNWKKNDRGADQASAPWFKVFNGDRINDHHLTLAEKRAARQLK